MANQIDNAIKSQNIFLERHYYKGGLRTDFFAKTVERPGWAPPPDTVGFRDEVALDKDDYVVEIAKFRSQQDIATWIGIYRPSIDEVYGNRRNHAGLGIWTLNLAPLEPSAIIDALNKSLPAFLKDQQKPSAKSVDALLSFMEDLLVYYAQLPHPLGGLLPSEGLALETNKYVTSLKGEAKDRSIDDLVLRLFYLTPNVSNASRALLYITERATEEASKIHGFEKLPERNFKSDLLAQLPDAFESQDAELQRLRAHVADQEKLCESLDLKIDALEHELNIQLERAVRAEQECSSMRQALEGNDEQRRYASLIETISQHSRQLSHLTRDSDFISSEMRALRNDLRSWQSQGGRRTSPPQRHDVQRDRTPPEIQTSQHNDESNIDWILVAKLSFILFVIVLLLFGVYFAFKAARSFL